MRNLPKTGILVRAFSPLLSKGFRYVPILGAYIKAADYLLFAGISVHFKALTSLWCWQISKEFGFGIDLA